jgi:glycosyltransferase involved in cell wall biosynthesis
VTNDIVTDQRVNRIAGSLCNLPADILIAGISLMKSPAAISHKTKRFRMLFKKGPLFYAEYNLRLFFWLLFKRADAIVANDLDSLPASFLAARLRGITLIYDSHEYFTELPELVDRKNVRKIWEFIERIMLPKISHSYTVSASIAKAYAEKYGLNMEVIRNLPRQIKSVNRASSVMPEEKIIIYQGALNMGRGLESAIRAMKYLNNVRLEIAGSGYLENELRKLASDLNLQDKVIFLGRLLPPDLQQHTCRAHLGISLEENKGLNYYYALPNKLFDYIQARIPVLVSDLPEMAAVVDEYGVGRVIHTDSPHELSEVMNEMLTNIPLRKEWQKNLVKASQELCWEKEEPRLLEIYRKALFQIPFSEQ